MSAVRQGADSRALQLMVLLCALWGLQQVGIKLAAADMPPLVQVGLRSGIAAVLVLLYMRWRRQPLTLGDGTLRAGLLVGVLFALEFLFVAEGLRRSTAAHIVVLLYSAPIFAALGLHLRLPGERLRRLQWLGIFVAFAGIILAFAGGSVSMLLLDYAYNLPLLQIVNSNNIGIAVMQGLSGSFQVLMHAAAVWATWSGLLNGLTIVLDEARSYDPEAVLDKIERLGVNIVQIVGDAMAIPIRDALNANPGRWNLSGLVNFGSGGAVFSAHIKDDIRKHLPDTCHVSDGMGSSETGISGQAAASSDGVMRLPANEVQQVVVDQRLAEVGETGLIARCGHTPVGYFGDPVKTAETFRRIDNKLWAVSGDAGRLDADGMITMFGRGSTCINTGGEKVFPEEVEEALRAHPAVFDAVVAGQSDDRWGERVIGIVSLRQGVSQPDFAEIKSFLADRLAGYKVPKGLVWVEAVRRSPAGKQDYRWAKEVAAKAT